MQEGGGIFRTGDVWECIIPFWECPRSHDVPLWIDYFFINNWIFHMFRMHVSGNHKVDEYSRYVISYTNEIHTPGYSQNGWSLL